MSKPKVYPPVEGMSIKALKKILHREEIAEADKDIQDWEDIKQMTVDAVKESHLSNDVLKKYRPSSAYLNARDYPTYKAEGERLIPEEDAWVIIFQGLTPLYICWAILFYIALFGI
tara:strand:+ start:232 stop:579 length:348 start_codon:yes stop_codon:yes gene_type:complete